MTDDCPHCPDGHEDPRRRPWGVYVSASRDGDGQPTSLTAAKSGGQHVSESDAEWARQVLNGDPRDPARVLDDLDGLAVRFADRLPGLQAVAQTIRDQVAGAMVAEAGEAAEAERQLEELKRIARTASFASRFGAGAGGPTGGPVPPGATGSTIAVHTSAPRPRLDQVIADELKRKSGRRSLKQMAAGMTMGDLNELRQWAASVSKQEQGRRDEE